MSKALITLLALAWIHFSALGWAQEDKYPPVIPPDKLGIAKALENPFPVSQEFIEQGKRLYEGRVFCSACHGKDGAGISADREYATTAYPLPRNFTDPGWQNARTDGELFWVLIEGSHGTDMAAFMPMYLTEQEAWQIITFIRTFGKFSEKL